jgi:hypothetical protein
MPASLHEATLARVRDDHSALRALNTALPVCLVPEPPTSCSYHDCPRGSECSFRLHHYLHQYQQLVADHFAREATLLTDAVAPLELAVHEASHRNILGAIDLAINQFNTLQNLRQVILQASKLSRLFDTHERESDQKFFAALAPPATSTLTPDPPEPP